jgi:hypothetical protein
MLVTTPKSIAPLSIDIRPAQMDDIYPILNLHREAFADKFGAAFGANGTARGVEAMAEAWRRQGSAALRGMLVASIDGKVIGTITLRTWEMGGDNTGAAELAFQQVRCAASATSVCTSAPQTRVRASSTVAPASPSGESGDRGSPDGCSTSGPGFSCARICSATSWWSRAPEHRSQVAIEPESATRGL